MSTDLPTTQYPEATGRVDVVYSQPPALLRWIECTTECKHIEGLFLLSNEARDLHINQLLKVFPELKNEHRVVRYANVKLDQHFPENYSPSYDPYSSNRTRPSWGLLFRIETRFTLIGKTSIKFQHRFLTVPPSQANRDFNNREEDDQYTVLDDGEEPERIFASAEGVFVFITWQTDDKGHRFFKPTLAIFQNPALVAPPIVHFLREAGPEKRAVGSVRPDNAFRFQIHLRKSDEDGLGHVTNSRYVSLIHDVLTFGLRSGYYANGTGESKTAQALPMIPSHTTSPSDKVAVPAGSSFYKRGIIMEVFVGYERELKVMPQVYVWSWVEPHRVQDQFDVIRFEICSIDGNGQEQVLSLCRAIIKEESQQRASL